LSFYALDFTSIIARRPSLQSCGMELLDWNFWCITVSFLYWQQRIWLSLQGLQEFLPIYHLFKQPADNLLQLL
jgi:hypothetical protein